GQLESGFRPRGRRQGRRRALDAGAGTGRGGTAVGADPQGADRHHVEAVFLTVYWADLVVLDKLDGVRGGRFQEEGAREMLKPRDLARVEFKRVFRGYNEKEV